MASADYKDLIAWQRAMELATAVYALTKSFPPDERFGLTNQLRRSVVSIASNIAEGQGRATPGEFRQFLRIANGSRQEAETQLLIAVRLNYATEANAARCLELADECGRLLWGLSKAIADR